MGTRNTVNINRASSASTCQTALRQIFEREMENLLWLAEAIVGDTLVAESCVAAALLRADDGSVYVAPNWRDSWISRCVAREAIERSSAEIKRIAPNYVRDAICKRAPDPVAWDQQAIRSLTATRISKDANVFERAAFMLHAYLGFSAHECAILIDCHWLLIEPACSNAARRIQEHINAREDAAEPGFSKAVA